MDDCAPVSSGFQARHLAHGGGMLAACHKKGTGPYPVRITGLIEEAPDAAAAVIIVEISADVHAVHRTSSGLPLPQVLLRSSASYAT